jgi:predicted nucleic acid-binding protein
MILVDADIMVDIMRRHPPAVAWLDVLGTEVVGIPGLVAMELLQGCRNREEQPRSRSRVDRATATGSTVAQAAYGG